MPMLTAMSSRGQVVLPKKVRLDLNLTEGTQFIVLCDGGNILLKPVKTPSLSEFAGLLDKARAWAKAAGMTEDAVEDAVKAVRRGGR